MINIAKNHLVPASRFVMDRYASFYGKMPKSLFSKAGNGFRRGSRKPFYLFSFEQRRAKLHRRNFRLDGRRSADCKFEQALETLVNPGTKNHASTAHNFTPEIRNENAN